MEYSLYVHIPFCTQKCDYCDFFSINNSKKNLAKPDSTYVDCVLNEVAFYVKKYSITAWSTIYIGGGTPSILKGELVYTLVSSLKNLFKDKKVKEITLEVNPEDVCAELLEKSKRVGVTRISMGIQALDDKSLALINRKSDVKTVLHALEILKANWKNRLSVDFIAGLPGQTYKSFGAQFDKIFEYPVDHISLYTLTVEEKTPLYKKIADGKIKWSQEKADRMWILGRNLLEKKGFYQYEVSNFAKLGFESLHNSVYWNLENYIGVGSGATGSLYFEGVRWTNTLNIKKYEDFWKKFQSNQNLDAEKKNLQEIEQKIESVRNVEKISKNDEIFEYLMMGFRMKKGVSSQKFFKRFGLNLEEKIGVENGVFFEWKERKLASVFKTEDDTFYALNKKGLMLLNRFLESIL
ncbi:radical SAM family heme chaperone HemW [Treponema pectinovorum]|uniref:radical SAM family heme chaperone HemW n=1 Tax=Treponema pectinovorum TaxID=164 RepID=UPI0011CBADDA|nr:radical SAM family heme chaperone HemW [Treponema pectinovorum]